MIKNAPDPTGLTVAAQREISQVRREACRLSVLRFALTYLPAHFRLPPSSMHRELNVMLQEATVQRGARLAIAAPRGHAKSTIISLAYVLWCICYRKEAFILLISNALDQASDSLSHIKNELQSNPRLLEDFPEVCDPAGSSSTAPRWRKNEIITRGPDGGVKVTALGAETKIRGRRHKQDRPTLIILDDIENEAEVRSADQRKRKLEWFTKAVMKAGTGTTNIIVAGTILHYDALLTRLTDHRLSPGWTGHTYQAVRSFSEREDLWAQWEGIYTHREEHEDHAGPIAARGYFESKSELMLEGTDVLWPELEDYYELMALRVREGRASFDSEKQNDPVNPEDCYFQEDSFVFWDDRFESAEELIASLGDHGALYGACDPSLGRQGRHADDTAIITLLKDTTSGVMYVLDADIRRRKPDEIIDTVIQYHRLRNYTRFGMETNQFQQFLSDELTRRSAEAGLQVPVQDVHHSTDKLGRIQRLQPMITAGILRLSRRHVTLLDQLRQFPMGAHDDGPDALELAVQVSTNVPVRLDIGQLDDGPAEYDPVFDDRLWTPIDWS